MNAEEKEAVRHLTSALLAVEPHLAMPYPDDPRWTPWSRFVDGPLKALYALAYPSSSGMYDTGNHPSGSDEKRATGG